MPPITGSLSLSTAPATLIYAPEPGGELRERGANSKAKLEGKIAIQIIARRLWPRCRPANRPPHGADRNSGRLTIAQDLPHGSGAYVGRKKPVRRLGEIEAGKDRGAELFAIIAAKRCRRLIGYHPGAASEGPGSRTVL
jgi:hypothetical protein